MVPLSPDDLERKETGDFPPPVAEGPGDVPRRHGPREFWQRAEDRNRRTAHLYDKLGLPEFYALEGLVQWRDA